MVATLWCCQREMRLISWVTNGSNWMCSSCSRRIVVGDPRSDRKSFGSCAVWIAGLPCGKPLIERGRGAGSRMVCADCAREIVHQAMEEEPTRQYVTDLVARREIAEARKRIALDEFEQRRIEQERRKLEDEASQVHVVYYVRLGENHVKIGTTGRLTERMVELRVANRANLLAAEPGDHKVERDRHRKFTILRYDRRKEDFAESPRLLQHIESVRNEWGDPWDLPARLVAGEAGSDVVSA